MQQRLKPPKFRTCITSLIISIDESLKVPLKLTGFKDTFICLSEYIITTKVHKFEQTFKGW